MKDAIFSLAGRMTGQLRAGFVAAALAGFSAAPSGPSYAETAGGAPKTDTSEAMIAQAEDLVRALYEADDLARLGGPDPFGPAYIHHYFSSDFVTALQAGHPGASLLHGAQDFDGSISEPQADTDQPMFRGLITINVDFVNFGQPQRAVFSLRADTGQPGAPVRIIRVEHAGWSFP